LIESLIETDDVNEVVEVINPKTKLTKVCEALDIDAKLLRFPANGFTIESLEKDGSAKRAKKLFGQLEKVFVIKCVPVILISNSK